LTILSALVVSAVIAQSESVHGQPLSAPSSSSPVQPTELVPAAKTAVSVYVRQGDRAFAEGKYAEAVEAYTNAIKLYEFNEYAYYNRGNAYRKLKDYKSAITDFTQAIKLNPQSTFALLYRGMALQASGQTDMAIADYTALMKIDEQQPLAYVRRAEAYASLKQNEKAREDFRLATELYKRQGNPGLAEKVQSQSRALK
jgi:tetratricopeptide (TPR) repeat protein